MQMPGRRWKALLLIQKHLDFIPLSNEWLDLFQDSNPCNGMGWGEVRLEAEKLIRKQLSWASEEKA